jgi:hypothetical protein
MTTILFWLGVWAGLQVVPLLLLAATIGFIKKLSDDPKNPDKPYFFTAIEPGRIKAVLRGGELVRYLMNFPGHRFTRVGDDKKKDEHWDVVGGNDTVPLLTPEKFSFLKFIFWPFFIRKVFGWYISVVYRVTGHVFVGIYPFQTLHIYKFTRKVQKLDELGRPMTSPEGLPILIDRDEMSDHVRARVFVWQVEGQAGETKEGLKVLVRSVSNVSVINPQKALFGSDRWDVILTTTILRTLASNMRTLPIDHVLTATEDQREELANRIRDESNAKLIPFGLKIDDYQIIDFEGQLSEEDAKALTAKWRAERLKEAARIEGEGRGQGRAAEITAVAEAVKNGGPDAKRAQELEAQIRQASEAGKSGGVVILGGQQSESGLTAALLAELKKMNERK